VATIPSVRELRVQLLQAPTGKQADPSLANIVKLCAFAVLFLVAAIALSMAIDARPALVRFGFGFLTSQQWDPVKEHFGALPFIYGTVVSSLLALIIGAPIALGTAIALTDLLPRSARGILASLVELLAAIPSVVYGLWGIFVMTPILRSTVEPGLRNSFGQVPVIGVLFSGPAYGVGMLAGGLIMAIMIVPTIAAISRDVIEAVPVSQREGMLALGATRWEMIWYGVLPSARSGILGGVTLGLGRALGETMAVTMLIGNRPAISASLFAPGYTMASVIANEFTEATSDFHIAALIEIGLVLLGVTVVVNACAQLLIWQMSGGAPRTTVL